MKIPNDIETGYFHSNENKEIKYNKLCDSIVLLIILYMFFNIIHYMIENISVILYD